MHQPRRVSWNASCDRHRSHPDLLNGNPEHRLELFVEHAGIGQQRARQFQLHLFVFAIASEFRDSNAFNHYRRKHRQSKNLKYKHRRSRKTEIRSRHLRRKRSRQSFANSGRHADHHSAAPAASSAAIAGAADSNCGRCITSRRVRIFSSTTRVGAFAAYARRKSNQRIAPNRRIIRDPVVCCSSNQYYPALGYRAKSATPCANSPEHSAA